MHVKVYADVLFCINFFMDFFILWIVSKLRGIKTPVWRLLAGSMLASGLYCIILVIPALNRLYNFFGAILMIAGTTYITFRPQKIGEFIKLIFFAHISAFVVGGAGIALFYFTNIGAYMGEMVQFSIVHFPLHLLIIVTAALYIILRLSYGYLNVHIIHKESFCMLQINMDEKEAVVTALIDTGNSLTDPISGKQVIVVEFTAIEHFFPKEIRTRFYEGKKIFPEQFLIEFQHYPIVKKCRLIPFSSLGMKNGLLLGFQADICKLSVAGSLCSSIEKPIIGISFDLLCSNLGYHALVHTEMLNY